MDITINPSLIAKIEAYRVYKQALTGFDISKSEIVNYLLNKALAEIDNEKPHDSLEK